MFQKKSKKQTSHLSRSFFRRFLFDMNLSLPRTSLLRRSLVVTESRQRRKGLLRRGCSSSSNGDAIWSKHEYEWQSGVCCRKLVVSLRLSILGIPWSRSDGGGGCFFPGSNSRLWSSIYNHPARVLSWLRRSKGVSHLEVLEVLQFVYRILVFSLEKVIRTLYVLFLNLFRSLLGHLWTFTAGKRLFTAVSSLEYNMCGLMLAGSCCCEFSICIGLEVSLIWSK